MANIYGKYNLLRKYITRDGINYEPIDEYIASPKEKYSKDCGLNYDIVIKDKETNLTNAIKFTLNDYVQEQSLKKIDFNGFWGANLSDFNATELTRFKINNYRVTEVIFLPSTSAITDMRDMFYNCSGLISLDVSNFDTSSATDMSYMFYNCQSLTSLDLSNFNTSKVTYMNSMFGVCEKLTTLIFGGNFDTSNVTDMSYMFNACRGLTSLDLSNFNTSKVTSMSHMFRYCENLTSLDLSSFDTSKVTTMTQMFYGCTSLTSLDLSGWDLSNVTNAVNMFYNSSSIEYIYMRGCNQATIGVINSKKPSNAQIITE